MSHKVKHRSAMLFSSALLLMSLGTSMMYHSRHVQADTVGQVTAIDTDKARYDPNSKVNVTAHVSGLNHWWGYWKMYLVNPFTGGSDGYQYSKEYYEGGWSDNSDDMTLHGSFTVPSANYRGYQLKVVLYDSQHNVVAQRSSAIDVSSDWKTYPRYASLTQFDQNDKTIEHNVDVLNKFHINGSMYYDAYYRPQNPFPSSEFHDWLGRNIKLQTIRAAIKAQHAHNQSAEFYDMINATTGTPDDEDAKMNRDQFETITKQDGTKNVQSKMGVFRTDYSDFNGQGAHTFDTKGEQATFNMLGSFNDRDDVDHKVQSYYNPFSLDWDKYIGDKIWGGLHYLGFDGWQGDTIGNIHGTSYENRNSGKDAFDTSLGYQFFANKMKENQLKNYDFGLNSVGGSGQDKLDKSKADFMYSEQWFNQWQNSYSYLGNLVNSTMQNSKKSLIVPAYMYHDFKGSTQTNDNKFNDNAILMKDISVFANGGDSMELTDDGNQLYNEYYPDCATNKRFKMTDALGNPDHGKLRNLYDFITAYENVLRGPNLQLNHHQIEVIAQNGDQMGSSNSDTNRVWAFSKSGHGGYVDDMETINLINYRGINNINWQVNNSLDEANKSGLVDQNNFKVRYYPDQTNWGSRPIKDVWLASPDNPYNGDHVKLDYSRHYDNNGRVYLEINVPKLHMWDVIYMK